MIPVRPYLGILSFVLLSACVSEQSDIPALSSADAEHGRNAMATYQCGVCHVIPGVNGAHGQVGPSLAHFAQRVYIAGKFPHTPDVLVQFIQDAPALAPHTAMPDIGVNTATARDMAAYLYTLQ